MDAQSGPAVGVDAVAGEAEVFRDERRLRASLQRLIDTAEKEEVSKWLLALERHLEMTPPALRSAHLSAARVPLRVHGMDVRAIGLGLLCGVIIYAALRSEYVRFAPFVAFLVQFSCSLIADFYLSLRRRSLLDALRVRDVSFRVLPWHV